MKVLLAFALLLQFCTLTKVFLFGGILVYDDNKVYDVIAKEAGK
jgi:hypothetical protein